MPIFKKKSVVNCALCGKELRHKYKPAEDWNISGFLCSNCHIDKTKEFSLLEQEAKKREKEEKIRKEALPDRCVVCKKELVLDIDMKKPRWQWNFEQGSLICKSCYQKAEESYFKTLNFCALCNKKMAFIRYNPKPSWNIKGQLCRECWDKRNSVRDR